MSSVVNVAAESLPICSTANHSDHIKAFMELEKPTTFRNLSDTK